MKIEKLKNYLEHYLDSVVTPRFKEGENQDKIDSFKLIDILKGSYQPPIYHVFIDIEPNWESYRKKTEIYISDFMKILSIPYRIKIHWNKRPSIKDSKK